MTSNIKFYGFADSGVLALKLAGRTAALLFSAIKDKGRATLVVSGGSTPLPFFEALAAEDIEWANVKITLADERWVPSSHQDSNERLVRSHLLQRRAAAADFVGLYTGADRAVDGEKECEKRISAMGLPFDVLVLGMGDDGHTASLFPGAENLTGATDMDSGRTCLAMTSPVAPHERMTLTLPALLRSENIFIHLTGRKKREVFAAALAGGAEEEMPIRFVMSRAVSPLGIYWAP